MITNPEARLLIDIPVPDLFDIAKALATCDTLDLYGLGWADPGTKMAGMSATWGHNLLSWKGGVLGVGWEFIERGDLDVKKGVFRTVNHRWTLPLTSRLPGRKAMQRAQGAAAARLKYHYRPTAAGLLCCKGTPWT